MCTLDDPGYELRLAEFTMRTLGVVKLSIDLIQFKSQSAFTSTSLRRIFVATLKSTQLSATKDQGL